MRDHGIEVTAIHNHMLDDQPHLFFMHFWANDDAKKLCRRAEGGARTDQYRRRAERVGVGDPFGRVPLLARRDRCADGESTSDTRGEDTAGQVSGRIDHLGIDMKRQRLLVAELGNNSLGVVDLAAGKVLRRIADLSEPQGVAYVPFSDSVFVANAGDGSVRVLRGEDLTPIGRIELGDDADNVRVDTAHNRVLVGYGKGALAVIDPVSLSKTADIRLKAHPEGFQIDETGTQVFVNVPDAA